MNDDLAAVCTFLVDAPDPDTDVRRLVGAVRDRMPARFGLDPIWDVQVLCPMHRGGLGAWALNIGLQQALNPPGEQQLDASAGPSQV